ncbi:type ISP restriction/modification enzyme, partial [Haemophilus haemolyticus]
KMCIRDRSMGDKKDKSAVVIFENYSRGIATARDAWCYNASYNSIDKNMSEMITFYDLQLKQFNINKENNDELKVNDFIDRNPLKISWSGDLILRFGRSITSKFSRNNIVSALYRPYSKQNLYFDKIFNERLYQLPNIFPEKSIDNKVICLTVTGGKGFSTIMTDIIPDLHLIGDSQCFPLYLYEKEETQAVNSDDLFANQSEKSTACEGYQRRDAITDEALAHFKAAYPNEDFDKEDMFYYIYGLLHSEEYREKYADNLSKQLPRIPCVKSAVDFWAFSKAGRELAELHLNYETVPMYQNVLFKGGLKLLGDQINGGVGEDFYVEKMKFGKKVDEESGKKVDDKTTVIYNNQFTLCNIPEEAYDYIVNGKPALEWVMERQSVKTDKASGIVNDANDWAIETMNNPRYPMELFLRVVTVSLETMRIVRALPTLNI